MLLYITYRTEGMRMYSIHYFLRVYNDEMKDDPESGSGASKFSRLVILKCLLDLFHRVHDERTVGDDRLANRLSGY